MPTPMKAITFALCVAAAAVLAPLWAPLLLAAWSADLLAAPAQRVGHALGGRRRAAPDSPNTAWRNAAFRGYADYMASAAFAQGMTQLLDLANGSRTTLMCAEAVWWRCHRSLIADALCVRGIEVVHILDATHSSPHPMTQPARVVDGRLSYAAPEQKTML